MADTGTYSPLQDPTRNETVAVGLTSVTVCNARQGLAPRKVLVVRNISGAAADIITVNLGAKAAVANNGIVLRQFESFTDSSDIGYEAFQGSITAICATANGTLAVFER